VTFDLDLDLEQILDVGSSVDHRVQVWWRSSHPLARISDFREITNLVKLTNFEIFKNFKLNISKNI